ncbi:MAG TPA: NAD(P)-binding domain-containing protein, partial [Phenylobacterium sp.]
MPTPILMLGAGRMGGAMIEGWLRAGAFDAAELMIRDPQPSPPALEAQKRGAVLNPPDGALAQAKTVVLAVKPQIWRDAAAETSAWLASGAVIVSIAAGVAADDIAGEFGKRPV